MLLHLIATASIRAGDPRGPLWATLRPFVYLGVTVGVLLVAHRGAQQFIYFQF